MTFCESLEQIREQIQNKNHISKAEFAKWCGLSRSNYATLIKRNSCSESKMNEIVESLAEHGINLALEIRLVPCI